MSKQIITYILFFFLNTAFLFAEVIVPGKISGTIIEKSTGQPVEFATVVLKSVIDTTYLMGTLSGSNGDFSFDKVKDGTYKIVYSFIGFEKTETAVIQLDNKNKSVHLGKLYLAETSTAIDEVQVLGRKSTFVNSIDRKTFNVGEDMMSKTGSVSELLQNVPSIQVDLDGNVSLRGSQDVTILINGKSSPMMKINRAAVLQQMPANSIEKIEVITNPSAKYKPDGTAGIINIVLKKDKNLGANGNLTGNVGNQQRLDGNATFNYNTGNLNIYGNAGYRQEERNQTSNSHSITYTNGVPMADINSNSVSGGHRSFTVGGLGADYKFDDHNSASASANYRYRFQRQIETMVYTNDSATSRKQDFNRNRYLPELETGLEIDASFQHQFNKEGHELNFNYVSSNERENEDNYYTNIYRLPLVQTNYDNIFYHHLNKESQFLTEYANPFTKESKLEAGYELDYTHNDMDLHRDTTAMGQTAFLFDKSRSNRFIRSEYTHVLYVTYERELGKLGFLVGLRGEKTFTTADLSTQNLKLKNQYSRLYPSLHLSYKLTDLHELQLNYSHRINRPDDEELNPYPEYQDMFNIRKGNPYLLPEDIHSFELGYQYKKEETTFISTIYYRYRYNGLTRILTTSGDTIISTIKNLDKNTAAGLELILSTNFGKIINLNLSANTFYNKIDATALGYSQSKSDISFIASANMGINLTKSTMWQINSHYEGEHLTPQGKTLPSFVLNTGLKQEIFNKKAAIIFTVSDVFNSERRKSLIDTPILYRQEMRKRSARLICLGFNYNFGKSGKKQNAQLKYDNLNTN